MMMKHEGKDGEQERSKEGVHVHLHNRPEFKQEPRRSLDYATSLITLDVRIRCSLNVRVARYYRTIRAHAFEEGVREIYVSEPRVANLQPG